MVTLAVVGKLIGVAAYMAFECWLGSTDKTKAGSVLEIVANVFRKAK
jgi:hypothetical protein